MSYCRWSSDNWKCDLYCYEGDAFTTHVATSRRIGLERLPPSPLSMIGKVSNEEFVKLSREHGDILDTLPLEDIDLPHAGETFLDADLESFKKRLIYLRGLGYHFPDYVLETIDEEIKERAGSPSG